MTILTARQNRTPQKGVQVNSITQFDINQFNRTRPEYDSRLELDLTPVEQNRSPHFGLHSDQDHQIISSRKGEKKIIMNSFLNFTYQNHNFYPS